MTDQKKYSSKLEGQRVLIIGGSSGIGFGVAEASLEFGAIVTIVSSKKSRVDDAISRLLQAYPSAKDRLNGFTSDLAHEDTVEANVQTLLNQASNHGTQKLDHIVFTAGDALANNQLKDATIHSAKQAGMVRFFAPIFLGKHCAAHMQPGPRASLTLTTGTAMERPVPGWAGAVVNGGLQPLSRSLALELAPARCNLISPGAVKTELWDGFPRERVEALVEGMVKKMPTGRIGRVEDVAEAYLYAMRDENLTGAMISTNGGALVMS